MRVFIYCRVSTDATKEWQDPNRQLIPMREFAAQQTNPPWNVVAEFVDFETGSSLHREEFRQMLARAIRGECDLIYVDELSRFSRFSATDASFLIDNLKKRYKVDIVSHSERFVDTRDSSPMGAVAIFFMSWIAEQERAHIKARVKSGIANKRRCAVATDGKHQLENAKCILCGAEGNAVWKGGRPKGAADKHPRERRWLKKPTILLEDLLKE